MMYEEIRRQQALRYEIGPGLDANYDRRKFEPAWESRRRESQLARPSGREYYMQKQDPANTYRHGHSYNSSVSRLAKDSEEVRAFGRQTILENLDHSHPHIPVDPRSNRAENFVYFPDRESPSKPTFSKAPGEPVRAKSDGCYIMTPSPPPPSTQHSIHQSHRGIYRKQ